MAPQIDCRLISNQRLTPVAMFGADDPAVSRQRKFRRGAPRYALNAACDTRIVFQMVSMRL
jgi:hypothetical protein